MAAAPPLTVQVVALGAAPLAPDGDRGGAPAIRRGGGDSQPGRLAGKAGPSPAFVNGTLSSGQPQLVGRGQGSKVGVLRFILKNHWGYAAGNYSLRLHFTLSSP